MRPTRGAPVSAEQVLITTGSQQALTCSQGAHRPWRPHRYREPQLPRALQAFRLFQATFWTADMDDEGATPAALEPLLKRSPKFAYLLPTFQNPTGRTMGQKRREAVAELFARYRVPLVEDDPYGSLTFGAASGSTLRALAPDTTLHLGTFSKILAPGLRLGWVIGPKEWLGKLAQVKQSADLHTSTLSQHVALEVMLSGAVEGHIGQICEEYGARCAAMLEAIEAHFPAGSKWTVPTGGMFVWVELPRGVNTAALLPEVVAQEKVAYVSVRPSTQTGRENTMRLNFTHTRPTCQDGSAARRALVRAVEAAAV